MAVDTAAKRFAMLNMRGPIHRPLFIPDGTVDAIDRAHLLNKYGGNAFGEPVVVVVEDTDTPSGGWWFAYEQEQYRRESERRRRRKEREKAKRIKNELDRALALAQRKLEEDIGEKADLERLTRLVDEYEKEITDQTNDRIAFVAKEAVERKTFSTMQRLERELFQLHEEEQFLILATQILIRGY